MAENKYKFNGGNEIQHQEFSDGSGMEMYDAVHRLYDPQLGRFGQLDPLASISENQSPYNFANNNPVCLNDPLGLRAGDSTHPVELPAVAVVAKKKDNTLSFYQADGLAQAAMARGITGDNVDLKRYGRNDRELLEYMFSAQRAKEREIYRDRSMENTFYAILASPLLLEAIPELAGLARTGIAELNEAGGELSLETYRRLNLAADALKSNALRAFLRTIPVSFSTAKTILTIANSPSNFVTPQNVYNAFQGVWNIFSDTKAPSLKTVMPPSAPASNNQILPSSLY